MSPPAPLSPPPAKAHTPRPIVCAVFTASDTRTLENDSSGDLIVQRLADAGHHVERRQLVREDRETLSQVISEAIEDPRLEVILITGGTGITRRDLTPDVVAELGTKEIPGFGELFRWLSYREIGASTIQSRACAWLCQDTLAFSLPGSTNAIKLAMDQILIPQLDIRTRPCNFAQLMPRIRTTEEG